MRGVASEMRWSVGASCALEVMGGMRIAQAGGWSVAWRVVGRGAAGVVGRHPQQADVALLLRDTAIGGGDPIPTA